MALLIALMVINPRDVAEPVIHKPMALDLAKRSRSIVSRGEPAPRIERRVMKITAYTSHDHTMNGRGITASGQKVQEGVTIAADSSIPFGTQIYIPALGRTYTVTDRGGAITQGRLDLYMARREDALRFGVQELEVVIQH